MTKLLKFSVSDTFYFNNSEVCNAGETGEHSHFGRNMGRI